MTELIYLDNAATTFPKPDVVHNFMFDFYKTHGVNPGRSGYDLSIETEEIVTATRKELTQFFNGTNHNRLVFTYNASDSLNIIINGMVPPGSHVISSNLEHNSVLRPLHHKQVTENVEVDFIPFDSRGYLNPDDFVAKFKKNTSLVILNHGSNVIGTLQPISEIGKLCKERGVPFAIDSSQTAGVVPVDVREMNIDVVAFTGHKSLMGPTGIGGIYVGDGIEISQTRFGGTGIRSDLLSHPEEYPHRLETGTINIIGVAGLYAGQKWIREKGLANIRAHENRLWKILRDGLKKIENVILYCADSEIRHLPVLAFNIKNCEANTAGKLLDEEYHIATRTGCHCAPLLHKELGTEAIKGTVRMSIGAFNTEEHIKKAIDAVTEIAARYQE